MGRIEQSDIILSEELSRTAEGVEVNAMFQSNDARMECLESQQTNHMMACLNCRFHSDPARSVRPFCHGALGSVGSRQMPQLPQASAKYPLNSVPSSQTTISGMPRNLIQLSAKAFHTF